MSRNEAFWKRSIEFTGLLNIIVQFAEIDTLLGCEILNILSNWLHIHMICCIRLNNRKARLARTARDVKAAAGDDNPVPDKQRGPVPGSYDSPGSPGDVSHVARIASGDNKSELARFVDIGSPEFGHCNAGQNVVLVGVRGDEIGRGKVFQVHGKWYGKSLDELSAHVVDISELKADKGMRLPYPSEATGNTFAEAETKLGVMRVLWGSNRVFALPPE